MRCSICKKQIPEEEQDFIKYQWINNAQKKRIGSIVVNEVPVLSKMLTTFKTKQSSIVFYCQKCLKNKLFEFIFEKDNNQ